MDMAGENVTIMDSNNVSEFSWNDTLIVVETTDSFLVPQLPDLGTKLKQ